MSAEEWRPVEGWPDYEVSNQGRVRRATDAYWYPGDTRRIRVRAGHILATRFNPRGYHSVYLTRDRKPTNRPVCQLVCQAFNGPRPSPLHEVAHWDGDKTNDTPGNLRWATRLENAADSIRLGRTTRGRAHRSVKLTEDQAREVKRLLVEGKLSTPQIAARFGVTYQSIQLIRKGRNWAWLDAA